jgi:hypothetical protein
VTAASDSDSARPAPLITDALLLERWQRALRDLADAEPRVTLPPAEPATGSAERRRLRRDSQKMVSEAMPVLPAVHRVAVLALVLCAVQAEVWDGPLGEDGWFPVVGGALQNLDRDDIPEQLSASAASWAATAAYLMHEHRPTTGRTPDVLAYEKATARVSYLFPDASRQLIADLAQPFTNKNGYPIDPDAVLDFISMVVQDDPLADAIDILEANHPAWDIHKHNDRLLHVSGDYRGTFVPAAEALDARPGTAMSAVWATGSTPGWTFVIRDGDSMIRIEKAPQGQVTWWHYHLGNLTRPTSIARDPELGNRARVAHGPLNQPFPEAIQALTAVGATPSDPPSACPGLPGGGSTTASYGSSPKVGIPPESVARTLSLLRSAVSGSPSRRVRSASLPGSSVPSSCSRCMAKAA